jgi:flagellar protein FlbD
MIVLTRMDKQTMYLNPDHIISIEETPDTVITLFNGNHYIVIERAATIISRVVAFRSRVVRLATGTPGRKYLRRQRQNRYQSVSVKTKAIRPATRDVRDITPFHSRDF